MPKQVFLESRNQTLEFPDDATQEEINQAIATEFPRNGEDVAFDMSKYQSVSDIRDFIAAIPDDDYIMLNNYSADKKLSWGDLAGIAGDALGTIVGDAVKGAGAAVTKAGKGVTESALRGVAAGTVDIVNLGQKLIKPKERIPTFEEFVAKTPTTNRLVDVPQQQGATGLTYAWPSEEVSATTEDDYKAFINRQRQAEIESLDLADISEKLIQGSPVPEVAKGASYLDAVTLAGLAKSVARSGVKSIYKAAAKQPLKAAGAVAPDVAAKGVYTGVETGTSFIPRNMTANAEKFATKVGEGARKAGFTGVQLGAGTVKGAADLGKGVINLANKLGLENAALRGTLGGAVGYQEGGTEGAVMGTLIGSAAPVIARGALSGVSRTADFIGAAAKVGKTGPSRTGIFEKMATSANISPEARKIAEKLLFTQPFVQYAGDVARQATKNAVLGAPVGAALGYAADGEQGAAAGFGAGAAIGGLGGAWDASYDAMKSIAGRSTARSQRNAAGDIKSFVNDITDDQARADYGEIMNRAIQVAGPERAADMLDSLRLAESMGATVKTVPPSQRKNAFNEFDYSTNTITINPDRMNAGSVQHEVFHQLFNVGVRGELQKALSDVYLPKKDADGNIIQEGLFDDKEFAKKAAELAKRYENNPQGYKYALEQASVLDNPAGFSPQAVDNAREFVIDEMTAAYTEKFMGRSRTGVFNPDRLPMWHRQILENIDDKILNRINDKMFADRSVKDPTAFFTDAEGKPVRVPQLDKVLKRAFSRKMVREAPMTAGKTQKAQKIVIPTKPRELVSFANAAFGSTRDILGSDENGNPRILTPDEQKAITAADFDAAKAVYQSLPDTDKQTVRVVNKAGDPIDINAPGARIAITSQTPESIFENFLRVAKDRGMGNQQIANMRQLFASMAANEGPTFNTVNNPVYKFDKKSGRMEADVNPPKRQEIYPTAITVNSAGGFNVEYIDISRVKENAQKIIQNPKYKGIWGGLDDFMTDFGRSLKNLSSDNPLPSAQLLGNGNDKIGAMKRDLIAESMNVTLPKRLAKTKGYANEPVIDPLTLATKEGKERRIGGSAFRDFRIERLTEVTPTNERLKMVRENAYVNIVRRYQPDAFTPETLPNGEAYTNPDGFRILNKTGSKLFRTYDDTGKLIGVAESKEKAVKKAMDEATKRMTKEEPSTKRFQPMPKPGDKINGLTIYSVDKTSIKGEAWVVTEEGSAFFYRPNSPTFKLTRGRSNVIPSQRSELDALRRDFQAEAEARPLPVQKNREPSQSGFTYETPKIKGVKAEDLKVGDWVEGNGGQPIQIQSITPRSGGLWLDFGNGNASSAGYTSRLNRANKPESSKRFQPVTPEQDAAYLQAIKAGDSETAQRLVDEAAKKAGYNVQPLYHGGNAGFNEFSFEKMGEQGTAEGKGFYFTNKEDIAKGYVKESGGRLMKVMLKEGNRLNGQKVTITRSQLGKIIDSIDPKGDDFLANYGDVTFEGRNKVKAQAMSNLLDFSNSDVDLIAGIINSGVSPETIYDVVEKVTGKFGIKEKATWGGEGHEINIATSPRHIKLADPVTYDDAGNVIPLSERFNPKSNDIRFQPDDQVTTAVPDFKKTPAGDKPLLEVIYFKNQDKFKEAVAKGRVQKGVPIETFENMSLAIHQPDSAMVGDVVMQGDKVVTGQGGVYYPVLFGDKGSFWASTEKAAKSMAEELNKISRLNNGKILMGLTSAPIDKMFSSTTMSNGMMQLLHKIAKSPRQYGINKSTANKILVDAVNTPLVKNDKKTGKTTVFKFDQRLRSSSSMEDNMSIMNELLAPDKSAFPLRKHFVQNIAKSIASHLSQNKRASQEFASLISPSSNKYAKGDIVKGKLSTSGIIQALGDLFSEEFTKDFQSITSPGGVGGYLYAILEMDGEVVPVQNKQHVSYDYSVDSTSGQQPKVHILDKPVKWNDTLGLVNTQDYVPESIKDNVYPTNVGFSFSGKHGNLMVMKPKEGALTPIEITRFQPDPASPNILNGSDGSRIIKSSSGKYRVYLATGALAGVKDTLESAQKLIETKSK